VSHILVIANETAASDELLAALRSAATGDDRITVIAPVNEPNQGYVVYEDTRRASARRRLERTLKGLREAGMGAQGFVVETGPVQAVKDALAQLEPQIDRIVVSTHGAERSGWMRRDVVAEVGRVAGGVPVEHVTVERAGAEANVLVVANQTVVSDELLARIKERAAKSPASFLLVAPQGDEHEHEAADRRLRLALTELRSAGIEAHGQIVHPDPYTAVQHIVNDESVDEIIDSTFPGERSGWLRRDIVQRQQKDTGLPVDHVVSAGREVGAHA
jgi:hypothetical protein